MRAIVRDAVKSNYTFPALLLGVVSSAPFQLRQAPAAGADRRSVTAKRDGATPPR